MGWRETGDFISWFNKGMVGTETGSETERELKTFEIVNRREVKNYVTWACTEGPSLGTFPQESDGRRVFCKCVPGAPLRSSHLHVMICASHF